MKYQEILSNLCAHDHRNGSIVFAIDSESKDDGCRCFNCTSGKTKLALVMLEMVNCHNCEIRGLNYKDCEHDCTNWSKWELSK